MCRLHGAFVSSINVNHITIWVNTTFWYLTHCPVTKTRATPRKHVQTRLRSRIVECLRQMCRLVMHSLLVLATTQSPFDQTRDILILLRRLRRNCQRKYADSPKSRALSNGDFGVIFASRKCSKEQAHLMIHHSSKISCGGSNGSLCSRSEGSGESAHLHRLTWAFVTVSESHVHARSAVCVSFMRAAS